MPLLQLLVLLLLLGELVVEAAELQTQDLMQLAVLLLHLHLLVVRLKLVGLEVGGVPLLLAQLNLMLEVAVAPKVARVQKVGAVPVAPVVVALVVVGVQSWGLLLVAQKVARIREVKAAPVVSAVVVVVALGVVGVRSWGPAPPSPTTCS